jgi:hypothetical protein
VPYVAPGASFLVVKNLNGFRFRYGTGYDAMIATAYSANFSDTGELVKLIYTPPSGGSATEIVSFTYADSPPWPKSADGMGSSLLLINPQSNPDPTVPSNWTASCGVGGQPGGVPLTTTWTAWAGLAFPAADPASIKDPEDDPDGDGIRNDLEYVFGTSPKLADPPNRVLPRAAIVADGGESYLSLNCRVNPGASDATITVETSGTLAPDAWFSGPGHTVSFGTPVDSDDGSRTYTVRDAVPMSAANPPRRFMRMKVTLP